MLPETEDIDTAWFKDAPCLGLPSEWFYGESDEQHARQKNKVVALGKAICGECSYTEQCLNYAIDNEIDSGVWGGVDMSARKQRQKARRLRPAQPRPCAWCYGEFVPKANRSATVCSLACRRQNNYINGITIQEVRDSRLRSDYPKKSLTAHSSCG